MKSLIITIKNGLCKYLTDRDFAIMFMQMFHIVWGYEQNLISRLRYKSQYTYFLSFYFIFAIKNKNKKAYYKQQDKYNITKILIKQIMFSRHNMFI